MKRTLFLLSILLGLTCYAQSQKLIKKDMDVNGKKVDMQFKFADTIKIEAWNQNKIELLVSVNIEENQYNDDYALNINEMGNSLILEEKVNFEAIKKKRGDFHNFNTKINYKLKVPANLEFKLSTISGQVEMKGILGKMEVNSISGFIDYTVPQSCKVRIDLSTISGNVYSNLKFEDQSAKEISWVGTKHKLTLNGGTQDIALKTISGNIYLRKN